MNTLIAFTGGLDSTYLLWRLLTQTEDRVHAFWVDFRGLEFHAEAAWYLALLDAESVVAPRVIQWLSDNVRPCTFEAVASARYRREPDDYPKGDGHFWRNIPILDEAIAIVSRDGFNRFVRGKVPESIRSADDELRTDWYRRHWADKAPSGTTFEYPLIDAWHGRPQAIANLPAELLSIALSCDNPGADAGNFAECGQCVKCRMTVELRRWLDNGAAPDVLLDYLLRRRNAGQYRGNYLVRDARLVGGRNPKPEYRDG